MQAIRQATPRDTRKRFVLGLGFALAAFCGSAHAVAPPAGTDPRDGPTWRMWMSSAATARSHARFSSLPPPTTIPLRRASVGLGQSRMASIASMKVLEPGVAVKRAINVNAVELKPLRLARQEIEEQTTQAVRAITGAKGTPKRAAEYRVELQYNNFTYPEIATAFSEVELVSPDTVAFTRKTMPEAYRLIRVLYRFINPD